MFTGLVEGMGLVAALEPRDVGVDLVIRAPHTMQSTPEDPVAIGDSVAINGCCLTIIAIDDH